MRKDVKVKAEFKANKSIVVEMFGGSQDYFASHDLGNHRINKLAKYFKKLITCKRSSQKKHGRDIC